MTRSLLHLHPQPCAGAGPLLYPPQTHWHAPQVRNPHGRPSPLTRVSFSGRLSSWSEKFPVCLCPSPLPQLLHGNLPGRVTPWLSNCQIERALCSPHMTSPVASVPTAHSRLPAVNHSLGQSPQVLLLGLRADPLDALRPTVLPQPTRTPGPRVCQPRSTAAP